MLTEKLIRQAGAHIDLPAPVQQNLDQLDDLRAQKRELETVDPVTAVDAIVRGTPALQAVLERRNSQVDHEAHTEALLSLNQAIAQITSARTGQLAAATTMTAEDFIAGPLRDKLNTMVDNARPAAQALAMYAPRFNADEILQTADHEAIELFQAAVPDMVSFDVLHDYWFQLLYALLPQNAGGKRGTYAQAGWLLARDTTVGGEMVWTHPDHVTDNTVRGSYMRTIRGQSRDNQGALINLLSVASQPPLAGFRLCTPPELLAAYNNWLRAQAAREHRTFTPVTIQQHRAA